MSRPPFGPRFSWRTADLRGAARLATEATAGLARIVKGVHQSVLGSMGLPGAATPGRTRGITGLVYRSIHGVTRWVDKGVQTALHLLEPAAAGPEVSSARRDAVLAALNGVMGDRLAAEANPLALPLQLRQDGQALDLAALHAAGAATGKLLVLVHGLCMNDRQWLRAGHDHGAHLAQALGYTPVYVFYNTGLHIADNGRRLAEALETLLAAWPVPVQDLSVLGHSMGGLVARAACHHGAQTDQRWLGHLRHLVCLGTPHHGAPLERAGQWVQVLLGSPPYSRPFVRLARLRSAAQAPDFIQRLAKRWLLDNPHRVTLVLSPDTQLAARRDRAERERLAEIRAGLDAEAEQQVVAQAKALLARQAEKPNADILPKVTLADVPADLHVPEGQTRTLGPMAATSFAAGTNGLVYQQVVYPIPAIGDELVDVLGYYGSLVTELGVGADDYAATQARQAAVCGGFSVSSSLRGAVDDEQSMLGFVVLSSKALARNSAAVSQLLRDTRDSVRFDEHARIRDLIGQQRARREQSITGNGHGLAMLAACAGMSPVAAISHRLSGLAGIQAIKALDKSLDADSARQALAERLQRLHSQLVEGPAQALLVADHDHLGALESALGSAWADAPAGRLDSGLTARPTRHSVRELWLANTQVNFCAKAFPSVPVDHPDAAALTVLGGFLRNGFLHRAIREQGGAYGGGASQDNNSAAFRLYSYRDPRLAETLDDFDLSVRWLLDNRHDDEALEQAILGVISSLDKPGSPAGEAKQTFHNQLFGRSPAQRRRFRSRVLAVSLADLQRVAETYLLNPDASVAVVTNSAIVDALGNKLAAWDFTTQRL